MTSSIPPGKLADPSDNALLLAIAAERDREAFALLFGRFAGRIKAFLIKSGTAPEVAEDVSQDVLITVWRKAASFDPDKASAATWIYTIARNRRIDLIRRNKRPEPDPVEEALGPDRQQSTEEEVAVLDRDERVRDALRALTEDQRDVVRLAFFAGLSHGEIAARLSAPLGTVKSRLRLAFTRLRNELGDAFSDELNDD